MRSMKREQLKRVQLEGNPNRGGAQNQSDAIHTGDVPDSQKHTMGRGVGPREIWIREAIDVECYEEKSKQ